MLPYLWKETPKADEETKNTVKKDLQQAPLSEERVEGGAETITE